MNYVELSTKDVKEKSIELVNRIPKEIRFDAIIFIARGAYQIGDEISKYYDIPMLEIFAKRKVERLKKIMKVFLKMIPTSVKKKLREKEVKMNIHEKNVERNVYFDEKIWKNYRNIEKILIVDDSVDTGNSMLQVRETVCQYFKNADVQIAALNVFSKSEKVIKTDYYIWKDTMLNGPWSNDSKYNKEFIESYKNWKSEE